MNFLANLLSFLSISAGTQNSKETVLFIMAEPECPKDLL